MQQLSGRLTALDPDAGEALRVIPYFDELLNQRAGLESVVRGAAVLSGAAARLLTPRRRMPLRVLPNGRREDVEAPPDVDWQCVVVPDRGLTMWLERPGPSGPVDAMVLERATQAARTILDRTDSRQRRPDDRELLEVVLDPEAPELARDHAARVLGYKPGQLVRVVAEADGTLQMMTVHADGSFGPPATHDRTGIGPAVVVAQAPTSARAAALALRLACGGTADDPGPRVVVADELGVILLLAAAFDENPSWRTHPDLLVIARGSAKASWLLETLAAVATTDSQRAAAAALFVHHSTLEKRLAQVQRLLGWDVTTPAGRLRLQTALLLVVWISLGCSARADSIRRASRHRSSPRRLRTPRSGTHDTMAQASGVRSTTISPRSAGWLPVTILSIGEPPAPAVADGGVELGEVVRIVPSSGIVPRTARPGALGALRGHPAVRAYHLAVHADGSPVTSEPCRLPGVSQG